jgi:hypothetical protein
MDELIERIRTAQDKMLEEKLTANTVVLNGKKYGCLFELGFRPSICGLTAELANLPDNMDFIVQYRVPQPKTNADRIRSMTDEELAEWLAAHNERSAVCPNFGAHGCQASCIQCWLKWLRQEADDGRG